MFQVQGYENMSHLDIWEKDQTVSVYIRWGKFMIMVEMRWLGEALWLVPWTTITWSNGCDGQNTSALVVVSV
jgi:hypothetical protein